MGYFFSGFFVSLTFFLLLRLFDEFKDAREDAQFRPYRAVPRGLVKLRELGWLIVIIIAAQLMIILVLFPSMIWSWVLVLLYLGLMTKEFFVPEWLKSQPMIYMISHMFIMPLIDIFSTGLDWIIFAVSPSAALFLFLIVTFFNGMVIEVGRKIRAPNQEETGVETYSAIYGPVKAGMLWICLLAATGFLASLAASMAGFSSVYFVIIGVMAVITGIPAILFILNPTEKRGRAIELSSGVWTLAMYLTLGGVPGLLSWI